MNPRGWYTLPVEVVVNGNWLVLVGEPPDEVADPDCEIHHCDSMGCRQSHVLASFVLTDDQRRVLEHLVAQAVRQERESARPLTLREQAILRHGLVKPEPLRWMSDADLLP